MLMCYKQASHFLKTGIDLYFGRWDTNDHRLTDIGLPGVSPPDGLPITYVCYLVCFIC